MKKNTIFSTLFFMLAWCMSIVSITSAQVPAKKADQQEVTAEHAAIGIDPKHRPIPGDQRTQHRDAQWFPDAGLGLFLHWDPASTQAIPLGWSMIPGRKLLGMEITPAEFERIVRVRDFNLDGKKSPIITPNEYWALAKDFNPDNYHPDVWLKKAKEAGFTYAVLTTKHHGGFALWPSAYGGYNTKNYINGRDLVKEYVEACRNAGLKVGLYFSGPDWHFEREYRNFLYRPLPGLPALDPDLQPRTTSHTPEEITAHQKAYADMVRGQVEEMLTNYGKIDLLWFDGRPPLPDGQIAISQERIRELQPGIVINTRMHGKGDYITPERVLPETLRLKSDEWGEFCSPWNYWSYVKTPFRPLNAILTDLVRSRNAGVNFLLGFGPMSNGDWAPEAYENVAKLEEWMKINGEAIHGTRALPEGEKASVLASSKVDVRYLYLLPEKAQGSVRVMLTGFPGDYNARLLGDTRDLEVTRLGDTQTVNIPADRLGETVRVVKLTLKPTLANVAYGTHERQVLDFYQAKSVSPTPVVFYIHGGGWNAGDKQTIDRGLNMQKILDEGISVVSINYRYIRHAEAENIQPPVIGPLYDAARALQFVRSKAAEWNIDKERIGATGGSAGGASSLWLTFHDDLADPKSNDPIARESTRLWCSTVVNAQTTLDPKQIAEWIPNTKGYGAHAFGIKADNKRNLTTLQVYVTDREKFLPWIKAYSPYELVTDDSPPFLLLYKNIPEPGRDARDPTHTANYGVPLYEKTQKLGVDCRFIHPGIPGYSFEMVEDYLIEMLKKGKKTP